MKLLLSLTLLTCCPVLLAMQTTQDTQCTAFFLPENIKQSSRIEKRQMLLMPNTTKTEYVISTQNPQLRYAVVKFATANGKISYTQRIDRLTGRHIEREATLPHCAQEAAIVQALYDRAEYIHTLKQAKK